MEELNWRSVDYLGQWNQTFEKINDFDGKYIKWWSSTDIHPKPIESNVKLNEEILKDWEWLIKCIQTSFKEWNEPP
jgi:hypothetical protein